ncbi:MAG: alcohol dehydrogenase catalytic domain-containing protein [Myxococcales bacterium]|nr:alcohol dehydrogenase catalytic domain-containing protein [Myxococcales bacterium]
MGEAIVVSRHGGSEVLELQAREAGQPGPGQVRVRVAAAGVNFIDVYFRTGTYPSRLPYVPGLEGAGTVEELGAGVEGLAVGDRVAWAQAPGSSPFKVATC